MSKGKSIFAVCDTEFEYACSFMEYLNQKRSIPFEVHAFTNPDELIRFAGENQLEILLISERAICDEIRGLPIRQLMILSEGARIPELEAYPSIYKYQSSDQVIREVLSCYGKNEVELQPELTKKRGRRKVLGIFSPVGQSGKTVLGITMGQLLAENRNVLYMNLEAYSVLPEFFAFPSESGLSEVLYYVKQEKKGTIFRLRGMTTSFHKLDILPPVQNPDDLIRTSVQEWTWLLKRLEQESNYEIVILDIGEGVGECLELLGLCDQIYMPVREDVISQGKIRKFLQLSEDAGIAEGKTVIKQVKIPAVSAKKAGLSYFEDALWNSIGDAVRQLLQEEGLL